MSPVHAEGGTQNHLSLQELSGALVSGLVCRSAAHSSWVFVSLWVSVSEWEPRHGWLMNGSVSISTAVPQSHHRDIHSLLQVSQKSAKTFCGSRSGELCGLFCAVGEQRTETLC